MKIFFNILITLFFLLSLPSAWALKDCPGSPIKIDYLKIPNSWNNCKGTLIATDKGFERDKYVGEWKNSKMHGQGKYYYLANTKNKGDIYEGEYKEGKIYGYGIYTWATGNKYVGEWKDSKKHGQGTYYLLANDQWKGDKYIGEFKEDNFHIGTYIWASGDKYVGEWKASEQNGEGTYYFIADNQWKGDIYIGEWKNGKKHGQGIYYLLADNQWKGDKYEGELKDDKKHGQGTYTFSDGRVWDGKWENSEWVRGKKYAAGEYKGSVVVDNDKNIVEELSGLKDLYNKGIISKESFNKSKNRLLNNNFANLKNIDSQNEINQESIKRERNKRIQLERELAELKAQNKKEKESITSDTEPPQIIITSSYVEGKQGTVKGKVSDNIKVAELTIDRQKVSISNNGSFTHNLFIPQDGIKISIEATDRSGLTTKEIVIFERNKTKKNKVFSFTKLNPLNIKGKKNKNSIALIIGISKYSNAPEAKYADRDANYFSDFAESVLGIDETNIKLISNNSASNINLKKALKIWLKGYSTPNKSDIYVFFAGHGLASADGKELYLLPYDGEPRLLKDSALLRSEIFDTVKSINPKSVTVFLDACYSGQTREKDMILADARPIAIVPIESDVPDNFTVFSASSGSEISGSLPEADHGLFSYFLMKGLEGNADANNDNRITNGELHNYVRSNVTRQAVRLGREQTPQLLGEKNRILVEFY